MIDYDELRRKAHGLTYAGDRLGPVADAIGFTENVGGEIWACGCNRGGDALFMKTYVRDANRIVRAFDTFEGLPHSGEFDTHSTGEMAVSYEDCKALFDGLSNCFIHKGIMPQSFAGLEDCVISVAHIDVDQYQSVKDCLEFIYPRVHSGGWIIIDDYNCSSCPGAKKAVDGFLAGKNIKLIEPGHPNPQARFVKP